MKIVPTIKEQSYNLRTDGILFLSFVLLVLGNFLPTITDIGKVVIVLIVVFRRNAADIPSLICLLASSSTFSFDADESDSFYRLTLMGIPFKASYYFVISTTFLLLFQFCTRSLSKQQRMLFFVWLATLPISIIISYICRNAGDTAWATSVITHLVFIFYFWGRFIANTWKENQVYIMRRLVLVLGLCYLIGCIYAFGTHLVFFSSGIFPCLAVYLVLKDKKPIWKIISTAGIACLIYFVFIKGTGSVASSGSFLYKEDVSSFTTSFFAIGSGLCGLLSAFASRNADLRPRLVFMTWFLIILSIACLIYAMTQAENVNRRNQLSYWERVEFKAFGDRGPIWLAVKRDVFKEPYFLKQPYQPVVGLNGELFDFGAHNLILEAWRRNGFLAGSILIFVYYLAIICTVRGMAVRLENEHGVAFLGGIWAVGIAGGLVNMFGLSVIVGGPLMLLAGAISASVVAPTGAPDRWRG
jgi:hypothetical protein